MMKNNFKPRMRDFVNHWRVYSLNDEAGAVICDYPSDVVAPKIPLTYNDETMTGFEYAFAGLLLSRGKIEDGLKVVSSIRNRYDGEKRNPWNEIECGSNYARSMASFALIPILSGFKFDLPNHSLGFTPYKLEDFYTLWSVSGTWGTVSFDKYRISLEIKEGQLKLSSFVIPDKLNVNKVFVDNKEVKFSNNSGKISFDMTVINKNLILVLK